MRELFKICPKYSFQCQIFLVLFETEGGESSQKRL